MNTYLDIPVLELEPDAGEDSQGAFERAMTTFDPATGPRDLYDRALVPFPSQPSVKFICEGRDQINAWFDFMYTVLGRLGVFWMPSWNKDFQPTEDVSESDQQLTCKNVGYTDLGVFGNGARDFLAIITSGPTFQYTHISDAGNLGAEEVITIDDPLSAMGKDDFLASFLRLVRLASDDVEMTWTSPDRLEVSIAVVELPFEVPPLGLTAILPSAAITGTAAAIATLCGIFGFSPNAGDKMILVITQFATLGAGVNSVTDSQGNIWEQVNAEEGDGLYSWWVYVCNNPTPGATVVTVTMDGSGTGLETAMATLMSVPGLQDNPFFAAQAGRGSGTAQPDSAVLGTNTNKSFCVGHCQFKSVVSPVLSAGAGYTQQGSSNSGQDNAIGENATVVPGSNLRATVITDGTSAIKWVMVVAAFNVEV